MKVNQIVGEHKKGFKAKIYNKKPKNTIEPKKPEAPKDMMEANVVSTDPTKGTATINDPTMGTQTVPVSQLQQGPNNTMSMNLPKVQAGQSVTINKPMEEEQPGSDPQTAQLTQLMNQAQEPWLKNFYAYRIQLVKNAKDLAGEPGAGMGPPLDAHGNLKPVEPDPMKWIQQNPSVVANMPADALPPGMKQPGILDRLKGLAGIHEATPAPPSMHESASEEETKIYNDLQAMLRIAGLR